MGPAKFLRRFLLPRPLVSLILLSKHGARVSHRAEVELSRNLKLGKRVRISSFVKIKTSDGPLEIGAHTSIASGCTIGSSGGTRIGRDCLIGPNVTIVATTYRYDRLDVPMREQGTTSRGISIGDDVLIGAGSCILNGAEIGSGVIIAAGSVVSGTIPPRAVIQGDPARVVFMRR